MPWHAVAITANGHIKPCCQWRDNYGSLKNVPLDVAFVSEESLKLRKEILENGLPSECSGCTEREQMVGTSRRIWFSNKFKIPQNVEYTESGPTQWIQADVNLSNVCNLKCRMCGSWASNQWFEEDKILSSINPEYQKNYSSEIQKIIQTDTSDLQPLIDNIEFLQRIDFKGGEPMLAKSHIDFLEKIISTGRNKDIVLQYTTNGTVVNPKILSTLEQFKNVRIMFSIEGTDKLYQYIRGGKFSIDDLKSTILEYANLDNVTIGFNVTIQAYNLLNLKNLYCLLNEIESINPKKISSKDAFTTICNSPMYLSPFVLPAKLRQQAYNDIKDIDDFKTLSNNLEDDSIYEQYWKIFFSYTNDLDKLRNENILEVIPELRDFWND